MSDTFVLGDLPGAGADRPVDERGTLDVRSKALEQIICGASLTVAGTVAVHPAGGLQQLTGSTYPSASVSFAGTAARAELSVAAAWPCTVQELAANVRDRVRAEATRLSGTDISRLDVTVHLVTAGSVPTPTRRVL